MLVGKARKKYNDLTEYMNIVKYSNLKQAQKYYKENIKPTDK